MGIIDGLLSPDKYQEYIWGEIPDARNRSVSLEVILSVLFADALFADALFREGSP